MKKAQTTEHDIFTVLGCLSLTGLDLYCRGKLTGEELSLADEHLKTCELCSDAAEGLKSYYSSQNIDWNENDAFAPDNPPVQTIVTSLNKIVAGSVREHSNAGNSKIHINSAEYWVGIAAGILLLMGVYFVSKSDVHLPRLSGVPSEEAPGLAVTTPGDTLIIAAPPGIQLSANIPYLPDTYTDTAKGILINPRDKIMQLVAEPSAEIPLKKERTTGNLAEKESVKKPGSDKQTPGSKGTEKGIIAGKALYAIEQLPHFPGGDKALSGYVLKTLQHPKGEKSHGTVSLSFLVRESGALSEIKVMHGLNEECNKAAINLISKMPYWMPALQDGKPVKAISFLKVEF